MNAALVEIDGRLVRLSEHCVDRYWQRVAVMCSTWQQACEQLRWMLTEHATISTARPDWELHDHPDAPEHPTVCWVMLGDDIAFPLEQAGRVLIATTCLCRSCMSDIARRDRNQRKAAARYRKRRQGRQGHGRPARRDSRLDEAA